MHEPKRIVPDIKKLAKKIREDAAFSSLVFDMRDLMRTHDTTPNRMRAAVRFVLHEDAWRRYRAEQQERPVEEKKKYPFDVDPETGPFFTDDSAGV